MKIKKIPYYLMLLLLTGGASLILGFLSFGGMYALIPLLPLAFAAFVLSVAYEGEIYLQNINGALNKLFKHKYLQRQIANEYLLAHFPEDTKANDCPQFFKDYAAQLQLLHQFSHKRLDKESKKSKKQIEKTLRDMEHWFAEQLFLRGRSQLTDYEQELQDFLAVNKAQAARDKFNRNRIYYHLAKAFSVLAGAFMGLGTTYLLVEAFSVIPALAAIPFGLWPLAIVPMALVAGVAYGLLTYNAVTDMINNDTIRKWGRKVIDDLKKGNIFMPATALVLVVLALALTICTAGTWWTVAKQARPLFSWMAKMPAFIMGVINPVITGFSSVVFNLQNTSETLEMIESEVKAQENFFVRGFHRLKEGFWHVWQHENALQMLNPFRLLLKLTLAPLRIVLFLGHLISIGVTADRVPGIPQILSALLGIISEGFEDAHYFIDHEHHHHGDHHEHDPKALLEERLSAGHSHSHEADLPTRFLKLCFAPVYLLAAGWDFVASQFNSEKPKLKPWRALEKQLGIAEKQSVTVAEHAERPSGQWTKEQAIYRVQRFKEKHLQGSIIGYRLARQKQGALSDLQANLRLDNGEEVQKTIGSCAQNDSINRHRFFGFGRKTRTQEFLENELPERLGLKAG